MAKKTSKWEEVKREIQKAIQEIDKVHPSLAKHLREHLVMNEQNKTFTYTGNITWDTEQL